MGLGAASRPACLLGGLSRAWHPVGASPFLWAPVYDYVMLGGAGCVPWTCCCWGGAAVQVP
jgi:hypothetical protein